MLSDLAKGKGGKDSPAVAIAVGKPEPLDPLRAMNRFIKAVKDGDAEAAYDAYCLLHEAHQDKLADASKDDGDDDGDGY